ncbi:unnamed protein product [Penicillium olsonii]|nr:unnamed protein product [Penicillium olsonii]
MQKGKTKLALDHVLIDRMEADEDEEDLESILQHGAQALFNDDESADIKYDIPAIEKLLDRSQAEQAEVITNGDDSNSNDQNQFNFARVWQMDHDSLEEVVETEEAPVDISAWQKILDEREREAKEHLSRQDEGLGRGKRKRPTISYNTKMGDDDDPELSPTASPMAKMRKIVPDQDYQEPDGEAAQSESDNESEFTRDQLDLDTAGKQDYLNVMNSRNFLAPEVDETTRRFRRVELPLPLSPQGDLDGANDLLQPCQACQQNHIAGSCPLRLAGPELCPLCGLAHYGYRRSCPHLQSTAHVQQMLQALDLSTEDPRLVAIARRYLQTCITSNQNLERRKAVAAQVSAQLVASPQVDAARIDGEHIGLDNDVNSGVDDGVMEGVVDLTQ